MEFQFSVPAANLPRKLWLLLVRGGVGRHSTMREGDPSPARGGDRRSSKFYPVLPPCFRDICGRPWKQERPRRAVDNLFKFLENLERAKGFEPSTPTLAMV